MADRFLMRILFLLLFSISVSLSGCGGDDDDDDDSNPDSFSFDDEVDVPLAEYIESDSIEVEGINTEAEISIEDGEYSVNGSAYTDDEGEVFLGDLIRVRVMSSDTIDTETETTLTIGSEEDTFTVTTVSVNLRAKDAFKALNFSWPAVDGADFYRLLEKPVSGADFTQLGRELESTSVGLTLEVPIHRLDWLNAEYMLEACTNAECSQTDSISVFSHMRKSIGYIKASNTDSHDRFGIVTLSADGTTLAVGAPGEDGASTGFNGDDGNNSSSGAGAVYVYVKDDDNWRFQSYIKASNTGEADGFGSALAISSDGNTLAVGAPFEDSGSAGIDGEETNNMLENSGAVYIFRRSGDTWIQKNYVKASNPDANDEFGSSLAMSAFGATLAVGAVNEDSGATLADGDQIDNTMEQSGAVYIFSLQGDNWQQQSYLKSPNTNAEDLFGHALALDANGNRLLIGSQYEQSNAVGVNGEQSDNSLSLAGAAYIYERSNDIWNFDTYLKASNTFENYRFAASVAISNDGSTIAIGSVGESSNDIGIDGNQEDQSYPDSGAVYVFTRNNTSWQQQAYIKSSNSDIGDLFGAAVSLDSDGDILAVGAIGESSLAEGVSGTEADNSTVDSGAVYAFQRIDSQWQQIKYVKAPNTGEGDLFGSHVSLDASGDTLAVGAPDEQSDTTNFGNIQTNNDLTAAGAAYLY